MKNGFHLRSLRQTVYQAHLYQGFSVLNMIGLRAFARTRPEERFGLDQVGAIFLLLRVGLTTAFLLRFVFGST